MQKQTKNGSYQNELLAMFMIAAKNSSSLSAFIDDLLTHGEQKELGLRWQIVKQLIDGVTQREVASNMGVSVATVIRGAHALKNSKGGFRNVLGR